MKTLRKVLIAASLVALSVVCAVACYAVVINWQIASYDAFFKQRISSPMHIKDLVSQLGLPHNHNRREFRQHVKYAASHNALPVLTEEDKSRIQGIVQSHGYSELEATKIVLMLKPKWVYEYRVDRPGYPVRWIVRVDDAGMVTFYTRHDDPC